jgi:hypothetical protein
MHMGQSGKAIASAGQFSIMYGEAMLKGVTAEMFARMPVVNGRVIDCNHPAWVYGHLSLYSSRLCDVAGIEMGPCAKPAGWDELFKNGTECKDDPQGIIYPKMEALTSHFLNGYKHLLARLPEVSDDVFDKPNPAGGRMSELLPTIGGLAIFIVGSHPMSHLGQISTWRRCVGLGSAM